MLSNILTEVVVHSISRRVFVTIFPKAAVVDIFCLHIVFELIIDVLVINFYILRFLFYTHVPCLLEMNL